MIDCLNGEIRDALPDLVHGRLSELDAATLSEHVASCVDCRAEVSLLRELRATASLAPAIDVARIAAALRPYSGSPITTAIPARKPSGLQFNAWRIAAAAALVAIGGWGVSSFWNPPIPGAVPSVESASATSQPVPETQVASLSLMGGVQDLTDAQIEQLLSDLDQIETIPSAEPSAVTIPIDDLEGGE